MINIKTLEINSQNYDLNNDYELGLLKGSVWNNLYSYFKYEPTEVKLSNDIEKLLFVYQIYSFLSLELTLFISTHPNNMDAINTLNDVNKYIELINRKLIENNIVLSHCTTSSLDYINMKNPWCDR